MEKHTIGVGHVPKLIPTLSDKKRYVLRYRNLRLYHDLGLAKTRENSNDFYGDGFQSLSKIGKIVLFRVNFCRALKNRAFTQI